VNKHFTITINDAHGIKQYNLHQFVIKMLKYVLLAVGLIVLFAFGTILYLKSEVADINKLREQIQNDNTQLKNKNKNLNNSITQAQTTLELKKEEISNMSDSLSTIELMIGLTPNKDIPLQERIDITKLDSESRATLLQFVPSGSPIIYKGITSKYGYRFHPILKRKEFHRGIDMRADMKTPVYATADGIVEYAGNHKKSGYGRLVIINNNYGFKTYFGHLNKIVVKSKQFVRKGDLIAYTGNSGMSNGPHLHYEIRFMSNPLNPFWFIKWNSKNYNEIFEKEKRVPWQSLIKATTKITVNSPTQAQPSSQSVRQ